MHHAEGIASAQQWGTVFEDRVVQMLKLVVLRQMIRIAKRGMGCPATFSDLDFNGREVQYRSIPPPSASPTDLLFVLGI